MSAEPVFTETRRGPEHGPEASGPRAEAELLLGLADARYRLRWLSEDEVRRHGHAAGMRARTAYSHGVAAAFAVARDVVRTAAWERGYAAGQEDAADERRLRSAAAQSAADDWSPGCLESWHSIAR
jgi:hypothetical protein